MPFETRRRLQAALPQQTATVFRHTAHYPTPLTHKSRPDRRGTQP
ncbi:TPA: hypothetical protein ACE6I0_001693 [Neisseria gonorrhoeae]|nr:hypothetical protein [Neisseria gonorrhoeae]